MLRRLSGGELRGSLAPDIYRGLALSSHVLTALTPILEVGVRNSISRSGESSQASGKESQMSQLDCERDRSAGTCSEAGGHFLLLHQCTRELSPRSVPNLPSFIPLGFPSPQLLIPVRNPAILIYGMRFPKAKALPGFVISHQVGSLITPSTELPFRRRSTPQPRAISARMGDRETPAPG